MSVQVVETYVVWVGKTDRIASFRKVEGYEDMPSTGVPVRKCGSF